MLYDAPIDVEFSEFDSVQPDLVIILNDNVHQITPTKFKVAPNLVVEILSPSIGDYDQTIKKDFYERSGVPEYWIVAPFEQSFEQWVPQDGKFALAPRSSALRLTIVHDIEIDLDQVW